MIGPAFALALLFVGSFTLEYKWRPPVVLPPVSQVEKDAAQAAEEIEARKRADHRIRENDGNPSRRPDLDPDLTQGVQSRGLHDLLRR